jgi:hypothetical protein
MTRAAEDRDSVAHYSELFNVIRVSCYVNDGSMRLSSFSRTPSGAAPVFLFFLVASAARDKHNDPDQIANRQVECVLNLYSIEKEIPLGNGLADRPRSLTSRRLPSSSIDGVRTSNATPTPRLLSRSR